MKIPLTNEMDRLFYGDSKMMRLKIKRDFDPMIYKILSNNDEILKFRDMNYYHADIAKMNDPILTMDRYCLNMPN